MKISSFEELAEQLRNFTTWEDRGGYDFGGAVYLLGACLENIQKNAQEVELEELADRLDFNEVAFLKKIVEKMNPQANQ